jgi:hypothetical protein
MKCVVDGIDYRNYDVHSSDIGHPRNTSQIQNIYNTQIPNYNKHTYTPGVLQSLEIHNISHIMQISVAVL